MKSNVYETLHQTNLERKISTRSSKSQPYCNLFNKNIVYKKLGKNFQGGYIELLEN